MSDFNSVDFLKDIARATIVISEPDLGTLFDKPIRRTITKLKNDLAVEEGKMKISTNKISLSHNRVGRPTDEEIYAYDEQMDIGGNIEFIHENLAAIAEMRILYLYKSYEVTLTQIVKQAYKEIKRSFFQSKEQDHFFKSLDIDISKIAGYKEVNQLRSVNNSIKHSDEFSVEVKKIAEFANSTRVTDQNSEVFLKRIKKPVNEFISVLSGMIFSERWEFDDARILKIASEYKQRMDKKTIDKFIEKLKE